jgi:signal peptidase I
VTRPTLRLVTAAVVLATVVLWSIYLRPTALGGSTGYVVVSGSSMSPTLRDGDLVVVRERDDYDIGDVIAFRVPAGRGPDGSVIHRVVGGSGADGYVTQGDNRRTADPWRTQQSDVIGERTVRVPGAGAVAQFLVGPFPIGVLVGVVLASAYWLLRDVARERPRTPHHIASATEVVALRIHRRYEAATDPDERIRLRQLAFETAGLLAKEQPGFDSATFLRKCGTYAYDGADESVLRDTARHQR